MQESMLIQMPFMLVALAFWIWMIIDCVRNERGTESKLVWLLLILLVGLVGTPAYFFMRVVPRWRSGKTAPTE